MAFSGINELSAIGVSAGYWYVRNGVYPYGTSGTIANGSSAGGGRMKGVKTIAITEPAPEIITPTGDNGALGPFTMQPTAATTGTITTSVGNQTMIAKANGLKVTTVGAWEIIGFGPDCFTFAQMEFLFNSPAKSQETSTLNEAGWVNTFISNAENFASTMPQMSERTVMDWLNNLTLSATSALPWGTPLVAVTNGSTTFKGFQLTSPQPLAMHTYISNGSSTSNAFTLDLTPYAASGASVVIWKNGSSTPLEYTTDYTVNATTKAVSLVASGAAGDKYVVLYEYVFTC
jgi:hypothetical protein